MLGDGVISSHPECFDQIILGIGFLQLILVLKSLLLMGGTWFPPSLSWDDRLELRANLQKSEEIFGPWSSAIFGRWHGIFLVRIFWNVAPPTSYFHGDHSHISPQISADQSTRHLEIMDFFSQLCKFTRGYWSSSFPLVLPNDLFSRPSKRDFVGLVSLWCVKFLWCLW